MFCTNLKIISIARFHYFQGIPDPRIYLADRKQKQHGGFFFQMFHSNKASSKDKLVDD